MKLYRPATVLVGILFVLLGGVTRLASPDQVFDGQNRATVHGTIGQTLEYNGSWVTVNRMKFVRSYLSRAGDEKAVETNGIFVAVEYDTVRGTAKARGNNATLVADGGSVYLPIGDSVVGTSVEFAEPGFGLTGALVFEVNPEDIEGLTLKVTTTQIFTVLARDLAIDLGVPDEKIGRQLIDGAATEYLIPKNVTRVAA